MTKEARQTPRIAFSIFKEKLPWVGFEPTTYWLSYQLSYQLAESESRCTKMYTQPPQPWTQHSTYSVQAHVAIIWNHHSPFSSIYYQPGQQALTYYYTSIGDDSIHILYSLHYKTTTVCLSKFDHLSHLCTCALHSTTPPIIFRALYVWCVNTCGPFVMTKLVASMVSMNAPARLTVPRQVCAISSWVLQTWVREREETRGSNTLYCNQLK